MIKRKIKLNDTDFARTGTCKFGGNPRELNKKMLTKDFPQ